MSIKFNDSQLWCCISLYLVHMCFYNLICGDFQSLYLKMYSGKKKLLCCVFIISLRCSQILSFPLSVPHCPYVLCVCNACIYLCLTTQYSMDFGQLLHAMVELWLIYPCHGGIVTDLAMPWLNCGWFTHVMMGFCMTYLCHGGIVTDLPFHGGLVFFAGDSDAFTCIL